MIHDTNYVIKIQTEMIKMSCPVNFQQELIMFLGYILYKFKLKNIVVFSLGLFFCLLISQIVYSSFQKHEDPILLWWNPLMGEKEKIISCSSKYTCLLTKDRSYINNTNLQAVMFYGSEFELTDLPIPKTKKWAIFHEESPRNKAFLLYENTYDLFEIVSTFSRNSDLPLTLQYLENLNVITDKKYFIDVDEKNKFLNSIAPVLYIQSDCDTPVDRDTYVNELMKYIQVDSYGACLTNKKIPEEISKLPNLDLYNEKLLQFISRYKFIIAFENGICEDYITEKLWRPLMVGSIPIYLGSPSVQDWLPNKNSAILVQNFASVKEVAEYVNVVNKNDELYRSFLEHKHDKVENELLRETLAKGPFGIETGRDHPVTAFECFVCLQIHKGVTRRRLKSVYNCSKPAKGNSWEYYWQYGECQSKALLDTVKNSVKLKADPC